MKKSTVIMTLVMIFTLLVSPNNAFAEGENANDLSKIVQSVEMISNGQDHFGKSAIPFSQSTLRIQLSYDQDSFDNPIKKGDKLKIKLIPEDYNKNFISMSYTTSIKNELMDSDENPPVKVADLDMTSRDGVNFVFTGEAEQFNAKMNLPFEIIGDRVTKYFKNHPTETKVTFRYKLQIDDKDVEGKTLEYTLEKKQAGPAVNDFDKTSGSYKQKGELGDGTFHYNIRFNTELTSPNEYVIYDLPDVNMGFDGDISIWDGENEGQFDDNLLWNTNTDPDGTFVWTKDHPNGTKVRVYDVYYVSKEPLIENNIRIPAWEEKSLEFRRDDVENKVLKSMDTAIVPKNILFEKPLGTKLTAEEQKTIENAGGLHKKVGKGFKVTLSDYKSNYLSKGGHITLVYRMGIKKPSPELNADGNPIYKNFATYYGQEIPNCKPEDKDCPPIKSEKTKNTDNGSPDKPAVSVVIPGTIGADVTVPETAFTKVEAGENGDPILNKPVNGATFTIYNSDANGNKKDIAKNKDGVLLENLITNEDGKLTKDGNIIPISVAKGYYVFSEISSPKGYEIIKQDTQVTVGYKATKVVITNKKKDMPIGKKYNAIYEFRAKKTGDVLPNDVMNLLPVDDTKYKDGSTVNAIQPQNTLVTTENGKWTFEGYDADTKVIDKNDVQFVGIWDYEENIDPVEPADPTDPTEPANPNTPGVSKKQTQKMSGKTPETGDNSHYFSMALLGLASIGLIGFKKKFNKF